jgi:predicted PurR-regulated permease PerM
MHDQDRDIIRPLLVVVMLGGLLALSVWVLRPFLAPLLWATMVVVATWGLLLRLEKRLGKRRILAAVLMALVQLMVFVVPLALAIGVVVAHAPEITGWVDSLRHGGLGEPPAWLAGVPLAGEQLAEGWRRAAASENLGPRLAPYASRLLAWLTAQAGNLGAAVLHVLLTVIFSALLYARGERAAAFLLAFARRLSPGHGEDSVRLAGQAVRGVALGVVVTAMVQSVLGGIGLAVSGLPFPGVLTAVMFLLAVAQIGAAPLVFGAAMWHFAHDANGWGIALLAWTVVVGGLDNFLRPWLIRKGADLPLLLIFAGVVGGLVAFGLLGLFVGPMVLAVTWKIALAWVHADEEQVAMAAPAEGDAPSGPAP